MLYSTPKIVKIVFYMFSYIIPPNREHIEIWGTYSDFRYLDLVINSIVENPHLGEVRNEFLTNFSRLISLSLSSQENTFVEYGAPPNFFSDDPSDKSQHHTFHLHRVCLNPIELALCIAYLLKAIESSNSDYIETGMTCLLTHTVYGAYKEYCLYSLSPIENAQMIISKISYSNIRKKYFDVVQRFDKMTEKHRYKQFDVLMNRFTY